MEVGGADTTSAKTDFGGDEGEEGEEGSAPLAQLWLMCKEVCHSRTLFAPFLRSRGRGGGINQAWLETGAPCYSSSCDPQFYVLRSFDAPRSGFPPIQQFEPIVSAPADKQTELHPVREG